MTLPSTLFAILVFVFATEEGSSVHHDTSAQAEHPVSATTLEGSGHHQGPTPVSAPASPKGVLCGQLPARTTRWNSRMGPLTLRGTVVIGPGATLVLGAGTVVQIAATDSCPDSGTVANRPTVALVVRGGTFRIEGTSQRPVSFKPLSSGKGFLWEGIRIEKAARDEQADLRWFELRRATKAVTFLAAAGRIEHGVIEDCGIAIASLLGASPTISHSVVSKSKIADLVSSHSSTHVVSCLFTQGDGDGLRFDGIGLSEIKTSCFWKHRGTEVSNGPKGVGNWTADSLPDAFGNRNCDPVLRSSLEHAVKLSEYRKKMSAQPWWKPRRPPLDPPGTGPWALSPFSPLIDEGERRLCADIDGSKCDIGLWGGK